MSSAFPPQALHSASLVQRAVEKWVAHHLGSIQHELRVKEIAGKLFDLTWPLHGRGRNTRRMLELAAVVHDVGRCIDEETHPRQGARMLLAASQLPLDDTQRRALAFLTRHHRGKEPTPDSKYLQPGDDFDHLLLVLGFLKAADALDSRAIESPELTFALAGRRLQITCHLENDTPKARKIYTRRKKYRMLEHLLGCRVEVQIALARPLQMVA
ncbi:MAG TPA: HD domain-containing protein [Tepidisphaeraceae bacterium]|nr:HD domain-containing protein [Tepidisphaeraceae bacterium]